MTQQATQSPDEQAVAGRGQSSVQDGEGRQQVGSEDRQRPDQQTAGGEAGQQQWWEKLSPDDLSAFLNSDAGRKAVEGLSRRQLQSILDRADRALQRGQSLDEVDEKLARFVSKLSRREQERLQHEYQQALQEQQRQAFLQQLPLMTAEQKVQLFDTLIRDTQQRQLLNQQLAPLAERQAVQVLDAVMTDIWMNDIPEDDREGVKAELRDWIAAEGIDPFSLAGAQEVARRLRNIVRERDKVATENSLQGYLKAEMQSLRESLRAELFGSQMKSEAENASPDLGGSIGRSSAQSREADLEAIIDSPHTSLEEKKRAYRELFGFDWEPGFR